MNVAPPPPHGELAFAASSTKSRLSRLTSSGRAIRLAAGVYAIGATLSPDEVSRRHRLAIIAHFWPDAVVCAVSALNGGAPHEGTIYIATSGRQTPLTLPDCVVRPIPGPGPLPGDTPLPEGLSMSGPARALVENVSMLGRPARQRAGTRAVEDRIDSYARSGGPSRLRSILDQLDAIVGHLDPAAVNAVRGRIVAALGTNEGVSPVSPLLAARLAGVPYDASRLALIEDLVRNLLNRPPTPMPALASTSHWEWLAFFEAYFSNFIEGTEFTVADARSIAVDGVPFSSRPEDAHDVLATYRLASDPADRTTTPRTGDELIDLLRARHQTLMAARPDKHPGTFKERPNYAGGYEFVSPGLVAGTLIRGFDTLQQIREPLGRAIGIMALVTECHPFDDGNGRVVRLAANAELSAAGEVRIVIPTVYRNNYLAGLNAFSNGTGGGTPLIAVLEFAQRWTAAIDWEDYAACSELLERCNAFLDPVRAESSGQRLRMP